MGDLKCGFEEVDGVRLGYLLIKGKQMFALSQVFNDLLKNIPRTTLHKRMDHLNVKKHPCDLDELRKLKAIHSVAFHAAKCTLISREDVEALNISCKTERVLKSKRKDAHGRMPVKPIASFCTQERFWLGLNEPAESLPTKSKACERRDRSLGPSASLLPFFVSNYSEAIYPEVAQAPPERHFNYEHAVIPSSYVAFQPNPSFLRSVTCSRRPIARQPKVSRPTEFPHRHKRRRTREGRGAFWQRLLLLPPKPQTLKLAPVCLERAHPQGTVPDTYSSESDSSCGNDSDIGSSMSSSSNSASSEEEEWEASRSDSSDVNSEDDSSSTSDSSSSQVSVESIRFRRTSFSSPACKPPPMAKANFLYHFASSPAVLGASRVEETPSDDCELKSECINECPARTPSILCCPPRTRRCFSVVQNGTLSGRTFPHAPIPYSFKGTDITIKRESARDSPPNPKKNLFAQQKILSDGKTRIQASITHSEDSKTEISGFIKKVYKKSPPVQDQIKSVSPPPNSFLDLPNLHNIKVEDINENEGYGAEITAHQVKYESDLVQEEIHNALIANNKEENPLKGNEDSTCTESTHTHFNVTQSHEAPPCTQAQPMHEDVEYRFGARVRQNYRKLVLGKRHGLMGASSKPILKSDTGPNSPAKIEPRQDTLEDFTVANKRKRVAINLAAAKRPFNFMANFPCPPSLIIGNDGDLLPACSLTTTHKSQTPHRVHPIWKWQLGGSAIPPPPSHKFRKF